MKLIIVVLLIQNLAFSKTKPVGGYVVEENSKALINVKVFSLPSNTSTVSNEDGFFNFSMPIRDRRLVLSKSGYQTDTLNVIFFQNNSIVTLKEVVIEDPIENIKKYISFIVSRRDKNIFHFPIEDLSMSGIGNLESILSSNTSILTYTSLDGQKKIAQRQFIDQDIDLLYDGIKLDGIKNSFPNLSFVPEVAISDLVITKGGHYKLTASQGAINSIPIVSYNNKFSLNIEQSNNSPNAYVNGYASLGYKYGTLNGSLAQNEFAIGYKDTNRSEIFTNLARNTFNIAFTNAKNVDIRFMSFDNMKNYSNLRTNSSLVDTSKNKIIKLSQWSPLTGLITLVSILQDYKESSVLVQDSITKNNTSLGFGLSMEKDFENSLYTFSTLTNISEVDLIFNLDSIKIERQNSIFSGSVKYFFPSNEKLFYVNDFSFVFTKERTTDIPNENLIYQIGSNYWDNTNFQIRSSARSKRFPSLSQLYLNVGNVLRTPSMDEVTNNGVRILNQKSKLFPEQNAIFEFGFTIEGQKSKKIKSFKTDVSLYSHSYTNKIKRILLSKSSLSYPVNAGNISSYGYSVNLLFYPKWDWLHFETMLSGYSAPDHSFFPSHPPIMLNHHTHIKTRYFNILIKMRAESKKIISIKDVSETTWDDIELQQANYLDILLYKNLNYNIFNFSLSLKADNLQSKKLFIDGVNLFNNSYSANIHLTIR